MTTMRTSTRISFVLAAALAVAACGKKEEPISELQDNAVTEMPIEDNVALNVEDPAPAPPPAVNVTNTVAAAPPPAFTDTEQMRDDADATGLTSRIPSDDAPRPTANETAPVAE
jgi:hypothetical protein